MRYFMIEITKTTDNRVNIYDLSSMIYQRRITGKIWRGNHVEEIIGKTCTVYVMDSNDEFSRAQMVDSATRFLTGDYDVYSLVTGELEKGLRLV
jgi:hypothetical protein